MSLRRVLPIVMLLALAFLLTQAAPASAAFGFLTTWGSSGTTNGNFQAPFGVATDASGNVYVADCQVNRVQKFDAEGGYMTQWGTTGKGANQFECARDVAVDATGVYVVDFWNNRVVKFNTSGTEILQFNNSAQGAFDEPVGVAADGKGHVYVADTSATDNENQRVQRFNTVGTWELKVGSAGSGSGQYGKPLGLATDTEGNLYVSDQTNNRVVKFNSAGNSAGSRRPALPSSSDRAVAIPASPSRSASSAAAGLATTTRSCPAASSCARAANASRSSRFTRLRSTAPPTLRETDKPSRGLLVPTLGNVYSTRYRLAVERPWR